MWIRCVFCMGTSVSRITHFMCAAVEWHKDVQPMSSFLSSPQSHVHILPPVSPRLCPWFWLSCDFLFFGLVLFPARSHGRSGPGRTVRGSRLCPCKSRPWVTNQAGQASRVCAQSDSAAALSREEARARIPACRTSVSASRMIVSNWRLTSEAGKIQTFYGSLLKCCCFSIFFFIFETECFSLFLDVLQHHFFVTQLWAD